MENTPHTQFDAAEDRGRETWMTEPRAQSALYDRETKRLYLEMVNGCFYGFPIALVPDLQGADPAALSDVLVDSQGFNVHFPALDVDLYVPALVSGIFGTKDWMTRALAQVAGRVSTPAKAAAARTNGAKGGRPRTQPAEA